MATLEDGLYATEASIKDPAKAARLARFVKASMEGWKYAESHQDEAVKIVLANDTSGAQTEAHQKRMMSEIAKLLEPAPHGLGYLDVAAYNRTVNELMAGGSAPVITHKPEGAWTHAIWDKAMGEVDTARRGAARAHLSLRVDQGSGEAPYEAANQTGEGSLRLAGGEGESLLLALGAHGPRNDSWAVRQRFRGRNQALLASRRNGSDHRRHRRLQHRQTSGNALAQRRRLCCASRSPPPRRTPGCGPRAAPTRHRP